MQLCPSCREPQAGDAFVHPTKGRSASCAVCVLRREGSSALSVAELEIEASLLKHEQWLHDHDHRIFHVEAATARHRAARLSARRRRRGGTAARGDDGGRRVAESFVVLDVDGESAPSSDAESAASSDAPRRAAAHVARLERMVASLRRAVGGLLLLLRAPAASVAQRVARGWAGRRRARRRRAAANALQAWAAAALAAQRCKAQLCDDVAVQARARARRVARLGRGLRAAHVTTAIAAARPLVCADAAPRAGNGRVCEIHYVWARGGPAVLTFAFAAH
ncbi:hypothetical protein M885DRAFT_572452 [Pelagophyceae sp. CCMP2097]|nr:hypothetical protein M885DRAFT_572452 [Pelagophyceae sp. CCMP2097]